MLGIVKCVQGMLQDLEARTQSLKELMVASEMKVIGEVAHCMEARHDHLMREMSLEWYRATDLSTDDRLHDAIFDYEDGHISKADLDEVVCSILREHLGECEGQCPVDPAFEI